jgi:DNA-binding NtrC family response regulator
MDDKIVLIVDDEVDVLNAIKRQFRKEDFKIITAQGGVAALEKLKINRVQVVISDERMPGMGGVTFLQEVKKEYPDTIRIILSGYADTNSIISAINQGEVYRFISKPWSKDDLIDIIRQAFSQYEIILKNKSYMGKIINQNRQLQKEIDSRNTALEISLEIINQIPLPLLVVTADNSVEIFNNEASTFLNENILPGESLENIFGTSTKDKILQGF